LDIDEYNSTQVKSSQLNLAQTVLALTLACCLLVALLFSVGICSAWLGPTFCYVIDFENALQ